MHRLAQMDMSLGDGPWFHKTLQYIGWHNVGWPQQAPVYRTDILDVLEFDKKRTDEIHLQLRSQSGWFQFWRFIKTPDYYWMDIRVAHLLMGHTGSYVFDLSYPPLGMTITERWQSTCTVMEQFAEQDVCHLVAEECTQGPETRVIHGESIHRDCWQKRLTYVCEAKCAGGCEALRAKGCMQVSSTCKEKLGETCLVHAQTYNCPGHKNTIKGRRLVGDETPYCLDGTCDEHAFTNNTGMMEAISRLQMLKEMQKQITSETVEIFKGDACFCTKAWAGFKDCCGGQTGWGLSLKFASCSPEEGQLAHKKSHHLCIEVGTYCAEKVLGQCIRKKRSYCCFPSKIARLIHEQGRGQLGLGWGEAKHPNCRGLTVAELSRLDLSRMNFSELFADLWKSYKAPSAAHATKDMTVQGIKEKMDTMQKGLKGVF